MTNPVVFGLDINKIVRPLLVDASGQAIVSGSTLTSNGSPVLLDGGNRQIVVGYGADQLQAYNAAFASQYSNGDLPAGTTRAPVVTPPAGILAVVTNAFYTYSGTIANVYLTWILYDGGTDYLILIDKPVTSGIGISHVTNIYVPYGWRLDFQLTGATIHNSCSANAVGYFQAIP